MHEKDQRSMQAKAKYGIRDQPDSRGLQYIQINCIQVCNRIDDLKISYEELSSLDEEAVYRLLFPEAADNPEPGKEVLDFDYLTTEMKRKG